MATLTVAARNSDPVLQPAGDPSDTFRNDGITELIVYNTGPDDVEITAAAARECNHGFLDDWTETVLAGNAFRFGPFKSSQFNDATGMVVVSYADSSDLEVAAQRQR